MFSASNTSEFLIHLKEIKNRNINLLTVSFFILALLKSEESLAQSNICVNATPFGGVTILEFKQSYKDTFYIRVNFPSYSITKKFSHWGISYDYVNPQINRIIFEANPNVGVNFHWYRCGSSNEADGD